MGYKLQYIRAESEQCYTTPNGFLELDRDVDTYYRNLPARNYVILRVDLLDGLTDVFSSTMIKTYREVIYAIIAGMVREKEKLSTYLTALYQTDEMFKKFLGELYYFEFQSEKETFFDAIIKKILGIVRQQLIELKEYLSLSNTSIIFDSHGFYYIAVRDVDCVVLLPKYYKGEVLRSGKVWNNNIQKR